MNKLIKIELYKVLHKKSIYIILILIIIFIIINSILIYIDNYSNQTKNISKQTLKTLQEELQKEQNNTTTYIETKTKYDIESKKENYNINSWQYNKIETYLYDEIYNINYYTYIEPNEEYIQNLTQTLQEKEQALEDNNWQYFLELEQKELQEELQKNEEELNNTTNIEDLSNISDAIETINLKLNIIDIRITKKIPYNTNYLNQAVLDYEENMITKNNYDKKSKLTYQEKIEYNNNLSQLEQNKYIIENKKDINKYNTLNYQLRTTLEDYEIFIIMISLIISSTIVSEEISKGTIKLLLIKPYTRIKILLSKYLTIIIVLLLSIIFLYITQILLGGYILNFNSLTEKVVIYNYQKSQIMCYNILGYTLIRVLYKLPMLILISTLSFLISIITNNNIISIIVPLLIYTFEQTLNNLAITYNIKIMKYLLTTNWNLTQYLFGNISSFKYINIKFSITICIIYLIIFLSSSFTIFNNKDIKNI